MTLLCSKLSSISTVFKRGPTRPHMACFPPTSLILWSFLSFFSALKPHCLSCCFWNSAGMFLPQGLSVLSVLFAWMLFLQIPVWLPPLKSYLLMSLLSKISVSALSLHITSPFPCLLIHLSISKSNILSTFFLSLLSAFSKGTETNRR